MKTYTQLFKHAKYMFLKPTENWKQISFFLIDKAGVYALVDKSLAKYTLVAVLILFSSTRLLC